MLISKLQYNFGRTLLQLYLKKNNNISIIVNKNYFLLQIDLKLSDIGYFYFFFMEKSRAFSIINNITHRRNSARDRFIANAIITTSSPPSDLIIELIFKNIFVKFRRTLFYFFFFHFDFYSPQAGKFVRANEIKRRRKKTTCLKRRKNCPIITTHSSSLFNEIYLWASAKKKKNARAFFWPLLLGEQARDGRYFCRRLAEFIKRTALGLGSTACIRRGGPSGIDWNPNPGEPESILSLSLPPTDTAVLYARPLRRATPPPLFDRCHPSNCPPATGVYVCRRYTHVVYTTNVYMCVYCIYTTSGSAV